MSERAGIRSQEQDVTPGEILAPFSTAEVLQQQDLGVDLSVVETRQYDPTTDPMRFVEPRLKLWEQCLRESGVLPEFSLGKGGSIDSGHFDGFKIASHSTNHVCPYDAVSEFDGRIYVPKDVDVHDIELVKAVADATGLQWDGRAGMTCWRWGKEVPLTRFFFYEPLSSGRPGIPENAAFEYEMCLLHADTWLEVTSYWPIVFNAEEVQLQKLQRSELRAGLANYDEVVEPLKQQQCAEACWRIVALYAMHQWVEEGRGQLGITPPKWNQQAVDELRFLEGPLPSPQDGPPAVIADMVDRWLAGDRGQDTYDNFGIERPSSMLTEAAITHILPRNADLLIEKPAPAWVSQAHAVQRMLQHTAAQTVE